MKKIYQGMKDKCKENFEVLGKRGCWRCRCR